MYQYSTGCGISVFHGFVIFRFGVVFFPAFPYNGSKGKTGLAADGEKGDGNIKANRILNLAIGVLGIAVSVLMLLTGRETAGVVLLVFSSFCLLR